MKHTKNYMDAMWVIQNPEKYDNRDVVRANSFIEAYNEGYNKALSLGAVVNRRELLLDFADYSESDKSSQTTDECVDNYLDLIK